MKEEGRQLYTDGTDSTPTDLRTKSWLFQCDENIKIRKGVGHTCNVPAMTGVHGPRPSLFFLTAKIHNAVRNCELNMSFSRPSLKRLTAN